MRKLAAAALAFSAAVFLAYYLIPAGWLIVPAVLSAVLGALLALSRRRWLRPAAIALVFFALGLLDASVFAQRTVECARSCDGQICEITAELLDYPDVYAEYCRLRVRILDGELPRFKAIVYDNDKALTDVEPGDRIRFRAKASPADKLYGKPYDNYLVNGCFFKLSTRGEIERLDAPFSLRSVPPRIRHALCARVDSLFPGETAPFIKALMLGEKQDFYRDDALYVAMTRAGLMHVVAVSGLHIAFLTSLLLFLFGGGRRGALISIAFIWAFVLITGAGNAAVRAGFMQTLLLLAPLIRRENDPITSLSFVLALVLGINPLAAGSVSLQLSYSAMAGIIFFFERIYRGIIGRIPQRLKCRTTRYVCATAASTLSVMIFTIPLTAIHFGYVALFSLLTGIACLWAVSLCFCGAWIACALSWLPVLGSAAAWFCGLLARYILWCAELVSDMPHAVLYLKTEGALCWLVLNYALLLLFVLLRKRRVLRIVLPTLLSLAALAAIFVRTDRYYRENETIAVLNVGQGQCICAFSGDESAVIDCGNTGNLDDAGSIAGEYLLSTGRERVDLLLLTHLHADHADGVLRLMEMLPVDTLVLPADADDSEGLGGRILDAAARHGTEVYALDRPAKLNCGTMEIDVYRLPGGAAENERCLMCRLRMGETDLLATADATLSMERQLVREQDLSGTDILIAGHHGSRHASSEELLAEAGGSIAVISVGYNNYGHPAAETLERLADYGYTVYRTDLDGTIEIQTEKHDGEAIQTG